MIDKGQWWEFDQDTGVTPLLFTRSAKGFLMTTESQDLGSMSHPNRETCGIGLILWSSFLLSYFRDCKFLFFSI